MNAQKKEMLPWEENQQLRNMSPVLKLLWMILLMTIKNKYKNVTFIRKRGKKDMEVKLDDERYFCPPPRCLFSQIVSILRRIGRKAAASPQTPFRFAYTETEQERKLAWFINYDFECNVAEELNSLMRQIYDAEEEKEKLRRDERSKRETEKKQMAIAVIILMAIMPILGGALVYLLFL